MSKSPAMGDHESGGSRSSDDDKPQNTKTEVQTQMKWVFDDGGRSKYFQAEKVGDCGARALAIATGMDYIDAYNMINAYAKNERTSKRKRGISNARNGVYKSTFHHIMDDLGWKWCPTMTIGSGCKVHMQKDELPNGNIICSLSKHYAAVIDGELHDTYDCTRDGTRCVYGYWYKETPWRAAQ